jgi:hypothetical protein
MTAILMWTSSDKLMGKDRNQKYHTNTSGNYTEGVYVIPGVRIIL